MFSWAIYAEMFPQHLFDVIIFKERNEAQKGLIFSKK